ncbi:polysaccharide pyruvyl transferase family protein [Croceicoccus sp. F390]|uniref:Polysaccharide pyruvyl transferase family protein n=1 Tax=Croceicoccus esteveae TaxID=3075597 RepID=A0ABU2ZKY6_9SPHN|nr:polysaccharide pyruvyl transferase family protein [Croceicoccus sp. F390]MDT0576994.1 polysaccharide pyruvyl transferase family protein [Croceicoccus sp. F390]
MTMKHLFPGQSAPDIRACNAPVIARLQEALRAAMNDVAPTGGDYAILDFPNHGNIGDSAIYLGELALCRQHFGRSPALVTEANDDDLARIARLNPDATLLLHGGGNFGDLYPRHQQFRDAVLRRFVDRRIVMMPQSIHFENVANVAPSAAAIAAHPDFTMMVRDRSSLQFAEQHFACRVLLVPDMAFMLGAIAPPIRADLRVLGLMRKDKEAAISDNGDLARLPQPAQIVDWPDEWKYPRKPDVLPDFLRRWLPPQVQGWKPASPAAFEWLANKRLQTGLTILARGQTVLTDRLHAHILCVLLGIGHVVLDNSYGKIKKFSDEWTQDSAFMRARSLAEAVDMLNAD